MANAKIHKCFEILKLCDRFDSFKITTVENTFRSWSDKFQGTTSKNIETWVSYNNLKKIIPFNDSSRKETVRKKSSCFVWKKELFFIYTLVESLEYSFYMWCLYKARQWLQLWLTKTLFHNPQKNLSKKIAVQKLCWLPLMINKQRLYKVNSNFYNQYFFLIWKYARNLQENTQAEVWF